MTAATKFTDWLAAQKHRDDPVGDLARDAISDASFPWNASDTRTVSRYLARRASSAAFDALEDAVAEWSR
ncbi:YozE family protein [Caulobacter sp. CCNWLY153]|uniref:YozE family protein n=1 Tax=unclassified Caulobacter TaxID=2648921 RepID=UPI002FF071BA